MDFSFTDEQQELRRAIRAVCSDRGGAEVVRKALASPTGHDEGLWSLVAGELGLPGLAVSEGAGGSGGSFVDAAVALEEAGRALLPVPLLSGLVATTALGRSLGDRKASLGVASQGGVTVTGGRMNGELRHVIDGHLAQVVVVATSDGLFAVEVDDAVRTRPQPTVDQLRRQAHVAFDSAPAKELGDGRAAATAVDLLRVALAMEAVGIASRCLELTVDHMKTRQQFGRPIGSFQALQHRAADLLVLVESAASTAYYAAWAAADAPDELPVVAPLAKAYCADAAYDVTAASIQLHGGIGFTWEHDAHLYFKRAAGSKLLLGDSRDQRRLVAARAGLAGEATFSDAAAWAR